MSGTIRLTVAEALARFLRAQRIEIDGRAEPLFGSVFAIFGHGNVTCLSQPLLEGADELPVWRGQNEQSMALAAVAYAKANLRRRIAVATTSIGPGASNLLTAAGVAHTNRLPLLMLSGDAHISRLPDPVLQQVEHFHDPSLSVNDAFKPLVRYWDRVLTPSQLVQTLPQAVSVMLDPETCGPAFLALPQDVQGRSYDFPEAFLATRLHRIARPQPEPELVAQVAALLRRSARPLIISGGGVHYAQASGALERLASAHGIPVVETIAGRAALLQSHSMNAGPLGVTGSDSANAMAGQADLVLAVGTRLQDFSTGSWSVFRDPSMTLVSINVGRHDAAKHFAVALRADARAALDALHEALGAWQAPRSWAEQATQRAAQWKLQVAQRTRPTRATPSYAEIVGAVNRLIRPGDTVVTAAGGLPAELNMNWLSPQIGCFDIEFGYSCMGYEIAAGWGVKIARPGHEAIVLVGDGSYLMLNSELYSSVLSGRKLIVVVCDNGGFAVIDKLQRNTGNTSFNNLLEHCRRPGGEVPRVDFVRHASALGARAEKIRGAEDFDAAFARARESDISYVIVVDVDPARWSECDCWWDVGLPETSHSADHEKAVREWNQGRAHQRRGI
ncbi:MAG: 3D-(3,5/4)-trihydroxycyclohexane-1,2-dione acylhydrolase (decyclizing) [Betaproteobacteria bacterium]|nr:3D-(3,5/4)-trihydroxycyclohexane-1,2-dione acylhydrolase (decyclizing) [Betaproteobacteria bacterium]MDE2152845.1 3D-(3,5/4)-trihydroxycyclohexane-1,2-dione acylhydrolase (decyclizing) [Betaproteobacteria bacterium]